MHRSPGIYLTAEKNLRKPELGDHMMKAVRPVIVSNEDSYLQMRSQNFRMGDGRKGGKDMEISKEAILGVHGEMHQKTLS